ncbi:MAG: hypothetical protein QXP77_03260 [Candidatus Aenigmatarchaeota archaeon]
MARDHLVASIDKQILEKWKEYCKERCINSSRLIEKLIKEFLKKEKVL